MRIIVISPEIADKVISYVQQTWGWLQEEVAKELGDVLHISPAVVGIGKQAALAHILHHHMTEVGHDLLIVLDTTYDRVEEIWNIWNLARLIQEGKIKWPDTHEMTLEIKPLPNFEEIKIHAVDRSSIENIGINTWSDTHHLSRKAQKNLPYQKIPSNNRSSKGKLRTHQRKH